MTTRDRTLQADVLAPEAALALLSRVASEVLTANEEDARRLCERLEYLPLALILAGRLLAQEADVPTRMQRLIDALGERRSARLHLLEVGGASITWPRCGEIHRIGSGGSSVALNRRAHTPLATTPSLRP